MFDAIQHPLISIIIPVYNAAPYLEQCVDSVTGQTYDNIEIILVDDGSCDDSTAICDRYAISDQRIRVIHKVNNGSSSTRKAGIQTANGQYIMFLDGDDWLDCDTVEQCLQALRTAPDTGCVMFSYTKESGSQSVPMHIMDASVTLTGDAAKDKVHRRIFGLTSDELAHPERMENIVSCCMKLYKTEYALLGRYYDTVEVGTCEDGLFNIYALENCRNITYLDKPFYHYRKHDGSLVSTYKPNLIKQWNRLFSVMQDYIIRHSSGARYQEALNNRIALSITAITLNKMSDTASNTFDKIRYIKQYLRSEQYSKAVNKISVSELPLTWKLLILAGKYKCAILVYCGMLMVQQLLKGRR